MPSISPACSDSETPFKPGAVRSVGLEQYVVFWLVIWLGVGG